MLDTTITRRGFIAASATVATLAATGSALANEMEPATVEADIVVVGAGTAGLTCAVAAAEEGASVVVIAKDDVPSGQGGSNFAIDSTLTRELGIEFDVEDAVRHSMQTQGYRVDERQWWRFARKSGEAIDWLIDLVEPYGLSVTLELPENYGQKGVVAAYPGSHVFFGGPQDQPFGDQPDVLDALVDYLTGDLGQRVDFLTTATALVREGDGRVSGVVATDADGNEVLYSAAKAVVLATGDYANNPELVERYCNLAKGMASMKFPPNNTGDGHLMALEIGAAMQKCEDHGAMVFGSLGYRSLCVNSRGERFMNELHNNGYSGIQALQQGGSYWKVWDADFSNHWQDAPGRWGMPWPTPEEQQAAFDDENAMFPAIKAESLEELAGAIGVPVETFVATVERYNELCDAGFDEDFMKEPELLIPVKVPPFYASLSAASLLITLGGLDVTPQMQVLDTAGEKIEGLYALGATAGNFFGGPYTTLFAGLNLGRCVCFGYLTGRELAAL